MAILKKSVFLLNLFRQFDKKYGLKLANHKKKAIFSYRIFCLYNYNCLNLYRYLRIKRLIMISTQLHLNNLLGILTLKVVVDGERERYVAAL